MGAAMSNTLFCDSSVVEELVKQQLNLSVNEGLFTQLPNPGTPDDMPGSTIMIDRLQQVFQLTTTGLGSFYSDEKSRTHLRTLLVNEERFLKELEENGDIDREDTITGLTPLMICAALGRCDLGLKLIERGASLRIKDTCFVNTLMLACIRGQTEFIEKLLNSQANIKHTESTSSNLQDDESLLGENRVNINEANVIGFTALLMTVLTENSEVVRALIKHGADVHPCTFFMGINAVLVAAVKGLTEIVKTLLEAGADVNSTTTNGFTPLMISVSCDHFELTELLLEFKADVNRADILGNTAAHIAAFKGFTNFIELLSGHGAMIFANKLGQTPLHLAAAGGHEEMANEILKLTKTDKDMIDAKDKFGRTPLFYASQYGHWQVVRLLLEAKANPYLSDMNEQTPLLVACQNGHDVIVDNLIKHYSSTGFLLDRSFFSALHMAINMGNKNIVNIMLPKGTKCLSTLPQSMPVEVQRRPLLYSAAAIGNYQITSLLLNAGADADINCLSRDGQTALLIAASSGHEKIVQLLVGVKGADANISDINGNTALSLSSHFGFTGIVKRLINAGADVTTRNITGWSALMEASANCHFDVVKILCKDSIVDTLELQGWTALMLAAQNGSTSIVRLLIEKGASHKIKTMYSVTALMISAGHGQVETTQLLIKQGADVNEKDINGYTPLIHACASAKGHEQVEILIINKADVNVSDFIQKRSPLCWSTLRGDYEITKMLIQNGASVNHVSSDGRSPLHNAAVGRHFQILKMLVERGANVNQGDGKMKTPLMLAASKGDVQIMNYLIHKGANCGQSCSEGWTPLMYCSQFGYTGCMKLLLDKDKESIDCREQSGHTALIISAANDKQDAVSLLLKEGAKPECRNHKGQTALILSAHNGSIEIVKLLTKYKETLNISDKDGRAALIIAVEKKHLNIVETLLEAGADVKRAIIVSIEKNNLTAVKLLLASSQFTEAERGTFIDIAVKNKFKDIEEILRTTTTTTLDDEKPQCTDRHPATGDTGDDSDNPDEQSNTAEIPSDGVAAGIPPCTTSSVGPTASNVESKITITNVPERVDIQISNCNNLIVNVNKAYNNFNDVQNAAIGTGSSINYADGVGAV